jgi:glucosamine-6-phosphate deaminase
MKTSAVESKYLALSECTVQTARVPYIIVDNFPELGRLTALRFLEWVQENPNGVISLPTGKTPEHFIYWTKKLLTDWPSPPSLAGLTFVQMDDFYPIDPDQQNSFNWYVNEYYIKGLGLDPAKALLINPPLIDPADWDDEAAVKVDNWCMAYEDKIRSLGGIGFFLGGIGPDGHVAFNIRGSDHYSTTRISETNYETQAAAAGDLGGIEISGKKKVITIGLGTITFNPDCVAIIFAAGDTKAPMVRDAMENPPDARYPGTALQKLPNARFYLTTGAASLLTDVRNKYYAEAPEGMEKSIRRLLEYCQVNRIYAHKIEGRGQRAEGGREGRGQRAEGRREGLGEKGEGISEVISEVVGEVKGRLARGMEPLKGKVILHTGPHHDDIMLGLEPMVNRQLREPSNKVHFAVMTSGFTALSNRYLIDILEYTKRLVVNGEIQMLYYDDFFESGYLYKWDKDVNHYLNKVAERDEQGKQRGLSHRVVRCMVNLYELKSISELIKRINQIVDYLRNCYDGEKNTPDVQKLKGMIREFEEELVWAHSGIQVKDVHHLRLGFYQGDIFTEQPDRERDVQPVLELLRRIKPEVISVTMDPEGSGPDTHYKVLQTIARAIRAWRDGAIPSDGQNPTASLRIMGYRNVWYRFHPAEANVYWPVSLNAMAVMQNSFRQCYLSQVDASFPSPMLQGPFCDLAQRMWVEQFREVQLLLGKDFFYENDRPLLRATHGLIFYKDLSVEEFLNEAEDLARRTE